MTATAIGEAIAGLGPVRSLPSDATAGAAFACEFPGREAVLVCDAAGWSGAGRALTTALAAAGVQVRQTCVFPGIRTEWAHVEEIEYLLIGNGSIAIAIGGGVVPDLVRLAAQRLGRPCLVVGVAAADPDDATWRYDWPAGGRLLGELDALVDPRGLRVIDLGCGRGRLGAWALARGAAQVVFADQSAAALAEVAARHPQAVILRHRWGEPLPAADLVLGGDILYRAALFPELLRSLASVLAHGGRAMLADPRRALEAELAQLAAVHGLSLRCERRPADYTLVRMEAAAGRKGRSQVAARPGGKRRASR